jgi:hypothetical protein
VRPELLPDILDVLSSEQFHTKSVSSTKDTRKRKRSSHPIVTPAKRSTEDDEEEETYRYNRTGRDDDFDLFDGKLLTTNDEVLAAVTTSITEV